MLKRNIVAIIITILLPTTHFLLDPKLRRSGAINWLPQHAFMGCLE